MTDGQLLKTLRVAETGLLAALNYLPYPSDVTEDQTAFVNVAINEVNAGLDAVRTAKEIVAARILDTAAGGTPMPVS